MRRALPVLLFLFSAFANAASTTQVGPIVSNVVTTLTDAPVITFDASTAFTFRVTIGGDRTMGEASNQVAGSLYTLIVIQDGTGSRKLEWGSGWRFPGATVPALSTTAGVTDVLQFVSDGVNLNYLGKQLDEQESILAPGDVTCSSDQVGQITFTWTDRSDNETAFSIRNVGTGFGTQVASTAGNATQKVYTVEAGEDQYQVRAVRGIYVSTDPLDALTCTSL